MVLVPEVEEARLSKFTDSKNFSHRGNHFSLVGALRGHRLLYLDGKINDSNRSALAFSSEAITRRMSLIDSMPRNCPLSFSTIKWKMLFCSISRRHSSSVFSVVTVTSSRVIISEAFIQAGHLFSAATLSEMSLWEMTPASLPLPSTTPTVRTCFSRRYWAA